MSHDQLERSDWSRELTGTQNMIDRFFGGDRFFSVILLVVTHTQAKLAEMNLRPL